MSTATVTIGSLPSGWCPQSPQDMLNMLSRISKAVDDQGRKVKLEWGVMPPDYCTVSWYAFVTQALSGLHGYIVETDEDVDILIPTVNLDCWIIGGTSPSMNPSVPGVIGPGQGAGGEPEQPLVYYRLACITLNDGTVVPIVGDVIPPMTLVDPFGRVQNQTDSLYYDIELVTLNDGTIGPVLDQASNWTDGGIAARRVQNVIDGLWYDLTAITENNGTIAILCNQTPHATEN